MTSHKFELFLVMTHVDERARAVAIVGERRKSVRALRRIDPWTRSTDLDVFVCIAADKTPLLCQNYAVEFHHLHSMHSITPRWHRRQLQPLEQYDSLALPSASLRLRLGSTFSLVSEILIYFQCSLNECILSLTTLLKFIVAFEMTSLNISQIKP